MWTSSAPSGSASTRRLVDTARLIQQSEGQLNLIESRLGDLDAQEKLLRGSLAQRQGSISSLLAAMQRMGRNPPPVMVTRREDALSMVRSAMLLASAFPELRDQALSLAEQLNDLVRVMTGIRTEGDKLRSETTRLNEARTRLAGLQETKRQSLTDRQQELESVRRAAADISKSVSDLSDLISKLDKEVADRTGLGTYEEQLAEQRRLTGAAPDKPGSSRGYFNCAGTHRRAGRHAHAGPHQACHAVPAGQGACCRCPPTGAVS